MAGDLSLHALGAELASVPELLREIRAELQRIRVTLEGELPVVPHRAQNELLTTAEAAEVLGLSGVTLATWRSTGRYDVPYLKVGRAVRYRRSDLEGWIKTRREGADP